MKYSSARNLINIILVILNVVVSLADAATHEESLSILKKLIEESNPSGSTCDADIATLEELSSGRDFVIFSDQVYVPDCNLPCHLTKPYWKVIAYLNDDHGVSAHILPRPDEYGMKYGFCDGTIIEDINSSSSSSVSRSSATTTSSQQQQRYYKELFHNYTMCNDRDGADPNVINNMELSDALLITNLLHRHLKFQIVNYGDDATNNDTLYSWSVEPHAYDDDILLACDVLDLEGGASYNQVEGYCADVRNRCTNDGVCSDIGIIPSKENLDILVPTLNALYGIGDDDGSSALNPNNNNTGACAPQSTSQDSTDGKINSSGSSSSNRLGGGNFQFRTSSLLPLLYIIASPFVL